MLRVSYSKTCWLRIEHIWFDKIETLTTHLQASSSDVVFLHGVDSTDTFGKYAKNLGKQYSIIKDLSLPSEELFQSLSKHVRSYIKRAYKENTSVRFFSSEEILRNSEVLNICKKLYVNMYASKGMHSEFNARLANAYCEKRALLIGIAFIEEVPVVFDAVIWNNEDARLWLSASCFRDENSDTQRISRAHQMLEWEMCLKLKAQGVQRFDFGGISSVDHPDGITNFKMGFERHNIVSYQNYLIGVSTKGKLILALRDLYQKWKRPLRGK